MQWTAWWCSRDPFSYHNHTNSFFFPHMLEQVTWGLSHSCEFCTLHVCTEQPPAVFTGRGTCLFLMFYKAVSTYRSKNCTKEGFVLAQPCPSPLLAHCWPQSPCSAPNLQEAEQEGWAPQLTQHWLKWWQGPLLKIKFCLIFCAVLVSHIRE